MNQNALAALQPGEMMDGFDGRDECLHDPGSLLERNGVRYPDGHGTIEFTGPAAWTDAIMRYFNDERYFDMSTSKGLIDWKHFTGMTTSKRVGDVVVLPITSFSPGVEQMGAGDYDDPMAFVKHDFEGKLQMELF